MDRLMMWASVAAPLVGAVAVQRVAPRAARATAVAAATAGALIAIAAAVPTFPVDALSALGVPLAATLGWTLVLAAPRAWATPAALGRLLVNIALLVATFWATDARALTALWVVTFVPTWLELRRTAVARVYTLYAGASAALFAGGVALIHEAPRAALVALLVAILIRKAVAPFHSWLAGVFAAAPPGPVLLLVAPMVGAYALVRLVVPLFPTLLGERSFLLGPLALVTAAYAAGLGLVQSELRRVVAWIAISQSALVLVGLECPRGAGMAGGLVTWLAAAMAMTGLALAAWMLEARFGPIRLDAYGGLYRRVPALALAFLVSGLSLVAFPGTAGFASDDLLLGAVLDAYPALGLLLFVATALNGFTVLRTYMRLFHGRPATGPVVDLLGRERLALLVPILLVIANGLYPGPLVRIGNEAARQLRGAKTAELGLAPRPGLR